MSTSSQRSACSMTIGGSSVQPCCWVNGCQRCLRSAATRSMWRKLGPGSDGAVTCAEEQGEETRMAFRKYRLGSYEEMRDQHRWDVPERYNIALDVCDKHGRDRLAMIWEDWRGNERKVAFGELQDLSNKFANVLEANGVERGDRVATLLPSLPETAAVFLGTYKAGAILLSMSVLYGDSGIEHRLKDSGAKAVVTDTANRHRIPEGLAEKIIVMDSGEGERASSDIDFGAAMEKASDKYEAADTTSDDPAQLYYSSGTTGKAK